MMKRAAPRLVVAVVTMAATILTSSAASAASTTGSWTAYPGQSTVYKTQVQQPINADGTSVFFVVNGRRTVAATARVASLFAPSRTALLTLITCTGVWNPLTMTDTQRLLVSASLA